MPGLFTEEQKGPVTGMKPTRERVGRDEIREVPGGLPSVGSHRVRYD